MVQPKSISYKNLHINDLRKDLLEDFDRYQETNHVWYKNGAEYGVKGDSFTDEWDGRERREVIQSLKDCLQNGGYVVGAFHHERLIGFANVEGERFGSQLQYVELPYIHVSKEYRGHGLGKPLFRKCCEAAKKIGATKLYIAAHPAVETQAFYHSVGCSYAEEINEAILSKEPLDIQLECLL